MECGMASLPIKTLQLIDQHGAIDFVYGHRQGKWIRFTATRQRADECKTAGLVVRMIGDD
jgi:hypothetical protein